MRGSADAGDGENGVAAVAVPVVKRAGSVADGIGGLGPVALVLFFLRWAARSGGRTPARGRLLLTTSRSP
jgi:hypothetical protein